MASNGGGMLLQYRKCTKVAIEHFIQASNSTRRTYVVAVERADFRIPWPARAIDGLEREQSTP
eukprot:scaffold2299_cov131-Cylindrotheca_fusiformis.AAC.6